MQTIPMLRIEFLDARVRVRMLHDGRVLLVEQVVDDSSAAGAPLGDDLHRTAETAEGGALPPHAMGNASEGSSSRALSVPEGVGDGDPMVSAALPLGDDLQRTAEVPAALGSLSACLAALGGPSVEELASWVEGARGAMSPRAAWYVVYRLLRERGGLRMSGNRFTLAVNALCRYGWRKPGFRDIPLAFRDRPVMEWSDESTGHLSSGRAYAALAQAFARLLS